MSEIIRPTTVGYWNCLHNDNHDAKRDYIEALLGIYQPDALVLTECREELAVKLNNDNPYVDYEISRYERGIGQGICVISKEPLQERYRDAPWRSVIRRQSLDGREKIRFVLPCPVVGKIAVHAAHISHPHHLLWNPSFNKRRSQEWRENAKSLAEETGEFLWFADTNTVLASTVHQRLGLEALDAELIPHSGRRTWGYGNSRTPRMLYLDRCAASSGIKAITTLETAYDIGQNICPSDHQPIIATIA